MTPVHDTVAELRLTIAKAEERAREAARRAAQLKVQGAESYRFDQVVSDLQVAIHGDICDTLDRLDPKLGTRLFQALHGDVGLTGALR